MVHALRTHHLRSTHPLALDREFRRGVKRRHGNKSARDTGYTLAAIVPKGLGLDASHYEVRQILSLTPTPRIWRRGRSLRG